MQIMTCLLEPYQKKTSKRKLDQLVAEFICFHYRDFPVFLCKGLQFEFHNIPYIVNFFILILMGALLVFIRPCTTHMLDQIHYSLSKESNPCLVLHFNQPLMKEVKHDII